MVSSSTVHELKMSMATLTGPRVLLEAGVEAEKLRHPIGHRFGGRGQGRDQVFHHPGGRGQGRDLRSGTKRKLVKVTV